MNYREAMANFRGHRTPNVNIIGRQKLWFALSGFFILLSILGLAVRGLNFSIDFNGGSLLSYPCPKCATGEVTPNDVLSTLAEAGFRDAEVQIVNGDSISARTSSLTELGSQPHTILRFDNPENASSDELRAVLAQFGEPDADIKVTATGVEIRSDPLTQLPSQITLAYPNEKNLQETDISTTLVGLGYPTALVQIFGDTVVVSMDKLPAHPKPPPTPSPAPTGSPSAVISSPTPSVSSSSAPAQAKGKKGKQQASATPTPTTFATPTPAPTPTQQGRDDVLAALAEQQGITTDQITLRNLAETIEDDVIQELATTAGVSPSSVEVHEVTGREVQRLLQSLADQAGTSIANVNRQDVGPTWGQQISSKAVKGLIIFLIAVSLYIAFRFEWKMALSAQTALIHDLVITAGIYALVGRTVTPATVIAILTILGYSLYDTVVIFDKVKENAESQALVARETYSGMVNMSLNQVLMRSVNTSLVVLLPILALLLFGGSTLKDFAFALFVGVVSGTYSSIFLASPVLAVLKEREPKNRQIAQRAASRAARTPLQSAPSPSTDGGDGETEVAQRPATGPARPRPASSGPKKRRKTTAAQRRRR